jgi:hypothetical protein
MKDITPAGFPSNLFLRQVTIASGASVSELCPTQGMALVGIYTDPAGWTAAAIGYRSCWSGRLADAVTAYDGSGGYEQTLVSTDAAAAGVYVAIPQTDTLFVPFIQLSSRTAGTDNAVNQGAARAMILVFRNYLN